MNCTAIAPSPTAAAQRFVDPERTSPAAKGAGHARLEQVFGVGRGAGDSREQPPNRAYPDAFVPPSVRGLSDMPRQERTAASSRRRGRSRRSVFSAVLRGCDQLLMPLATQPGGVAQVQVELTLPRDPTLLRDRLKRLQLRVVVARTRCARCRATRAARSARLMYELRREAMRCSPVVRPVAHRRLAPGLTVRP